MCGIVKIIVDFVSAYGDDIIASESVYLAFSVFLSCEADHSAG